MKTRKVKDRKSARAATRNSVPEVKWWYYALGIFLVIQVGLQVYGPALRGPFVFDDNYLPMSLPNPPADWRSWVIGVRPLLMFSYWLNFWSSGLDTFSYHVGNVVIHGLNTVLVYFVIRKLLEWAGSPSSILAGFSAGLFLLHPAQSEAVAYVAGRSDGLSTLFFLSAFNVFLYRRSHAASWVATAAILLLFAAAIATKENTVVLPALLLLTDYFWNPRAAGSSPGFSLQGIRRNWRLYLPMALGGAAGAVFVLKRIGNADSAGFGLKDLAWYQYLFTQFRVFFSYLRLFVVPAGQTVDYDYPISRTVFDQGAIVGLAGIVILLAAAFYYRRKYPLACYGLLAFAILLAPTSSIIPIKDPISERRLYLPMIGLLLIAAEFLRRLRLKQTAIMVSLGAVLLAAGILSYQRSRVWSGPISLWEDAVEKSPRKARAHFQLGFTYFTVNRCQDAVAQYETVARLENPDYRLLVDWALAANCLNRADEAMAKLRQAAALEKTTHVYALIGMLHGKAGRIPEATQALDTAIQIDPNFDMTYVYRGHIFVGRGHYAAGSREYRKALSINPNNQMAAEGLAIAEQKLRGGR